MDLLLHERFHGAGLFGRDVLVGMSDAPEQIRKGGEVASTVGFEMLQRLERLAERRELLLLRERLFLRGADTQPGALISNT